MKTIITSYYNPHFLLPSHIHYCITELSKLGYDPSVMISRHNGKKNSHICYLNFLDALKLANNEDILICEDDFIMEIHKDKLLDKLVYDKINRVIWNGRSFKYAPLEKKGLRLYNGTEAVFVPGSIIEEVIKIMEDHKPIHLDMFLSQGHIPQAILEDNGGELLHSSGISKNGKLLKHSNSRIIVDGTIQKPTS